MSTKCASATLDRLAATITPNRILLFIRLLDRAQPRGGGKNSRLWALVSGLWALGFGSLGFGLQATQLPTTSDSDSPWSMLRGWRWPAKQTAPIEHDFERCVGDRQFLQHEQRAVGCHIVGWRLRSEWAAHAKQADGGLECEAPTSAFDGDAHHVILLAVDQLPSVPVPDWLASTVQRHTDRRVAARVRSDPDLALACRCGFIAEPAAIRAKSPAAETL